jgi:hypothetical protein
MRVVRFTIANGRITQLEIITDPTELEELTLSIVD